MTLTASPEPPTGWPVCSRENLTLGDPTASVGVCTLWTPRDRIARALDPGSYAAVGNLYSREGISLLLRNVLANPSVRHLVLCGVDLTGTGAALLRFLADGVDADHRIRGDATLVDPALPLAALDDVRRWLRVHDHRQERDPVVVGALVAGLPRLPACAEPRVFPTTEPTTEQFPAEPSGHVVRAPTVAEAWLRALGATMRFGATTPTAYGGRQRELLGLVMIVEDETATAPSLPPWLPVDRRLLERYLDRFVEVRSRPGERYAYGPRLRRHRGRDQLEGMRAELAAHGESRRAVAVLWDPARDLGAEHPPCLIALQARLRGGALHLVAYLRSSDLHRAWPYNAFGLRRLQTGLAEDVGAARPGELVTVAGSAHIYEECWPAAHALLDGEGVRLEKAARFAHDPRGSFVVRVEDEEIVVDHYAPDGTRIASDRGRSAAALRWRLAPFISLPSHALYLGGELERAETALRLDLPYVQDAPVGPALAWPPRV